MNKIIINQLVFVILTIMTFSCGKFDNKRTGEMFIIPKPNKVETLQGYFVFNEETKIVAPMVEGIDAVISFLKTRFENAADFDFSVNSGTEKTSIKNSIHIKIDDSAEGSDESYNLTVSNTEVTIEANSVKGVFYGITTLLQMLPAEIESPQKVENMEWFVPCVRIVDEPRFPYRGMHLDVCRHFVSVDFIKKQLDLMAMFKMNTFHWHLTEDQGWRIEIKKYPQLTTKGAIREDGNGTIYGGYYTQDEVKEIVAYAKERFINVIPEIELPGHSLAALVGYPHLSCTGGPFKVRNIWGVEPDVYCAGKEETFKFLEDVIKEVATLFPSEYFHIGGDECPKKRWEKCNLCQKRIKMEGLHDEHELQSYFIKRIEKVLLGHGKKMIGWDEILEGGLAPTATVMSWRGEKGGIEAARQGHNVIMTPNNYVYLDHYQGSNKVEPVAIGGYTTLKESYSYDPVPEVLEKEKAKHILGTQGNVWSEYMYTEDLFEYRIYPRIIALAEVGWTQKENKDFEDFNRRIENNFTRLDLHDVNYHIPLPEGPIDNVAFVDSTILEFKTTRQVKMVYTLNGSEPDINSEEYTNPIAIKENAVVKIRSVLKNGTMSKVRTIELTKQDYLEAVSVSNAINGLNVIRSEGKYNRVAELKAVTKWVHKELKGNEIKNYLKSSKKSETEDLPFACIFKGYISVQEDGVYEFSTNVDQLFIGENLLIDNDGEVKRHSRNNASIALKKGMHPIKIVYLNTIYGGWPQSWNGLKVKLKKNDDKKFQLVTNDMYFINGSKE